MEGKGDRSYHVRGEDETLNPVAYFESEFEARMCEMCLLLLNRN